MSTSAQLLFPNSFLPINPEDRDEEKRKKDERLENLRLKDQSNEFGDQELLNLYLNHEWMFWDRKYKETEKQKTELLVTPT